MHVRIVRGPPLNTISYRKSIENIPKMEYVCEEIDVEVIKVDININVKR